MTGSEAVLEHPSGDNCVVLVCAAPFPRGWAQFYLSFEGAF